MVKTTVQDYNLDSHFCVLKESATNKKHLLRVRFYYYYENLMKGTVVYIPESILEDADLSRCLIFGPIGVSPLARQPMAMSQNEFMLIESKGGKATLLQRYVDQKPSKPTRTVADTLSDDEEANN